MRQEEAGAVPMRMRWVHIEVMTQSIQNTMEIFGGGSARRASRAIMRPKCISMAGATGMAVMSTILLTVCGPLCICISLPPISSATPELYAPMR